jgi:hypothetical protein
MVNEYKAEMVGNELKVKPKVIKEGNNVRIQVPSFPKIEKALKEYKEKEKYGKRNIQ